MRLKPKLLETSSKRTTMRLHVHRLARSFVQLVLLFCSLICMQVHSFGHLFMLVGCFGHYLSHKYPIQLIKKKRVTDRPTDQQTSGQSLLQSCKSATINGFITRSKNLNAIFLLLLNWGTNLVLLVISKSLELDKCGLRHQIRNSKKFQNLTDFHIDLLF